MIHALEGVPFYNTVIQMMGHGWSISMYGHGYRSIRGSGLVMPCWAGAAFIEWKLRRIWNGVPRALALAAAVASASAEELKVPSGSIEIEFVQSPSRDWERVARKWADTSARAVSAYYGKFPVPRSKLRITAAAGSRATGGTAFGWRPPFIRISLGRQATLSTLGDDWLLTHEMVHLALPSLVEEHHWLEEGLATYVEPIARSRIGALTRERVWRDLIDGLPQGQPQSGDRGLDGTPTWGRTYWGGALFCLRADVTIRQRTSNRFGLEDSLRAILAAGGSIDRDWTIDRVLEVGDRAVGVPVLRELYEEMGSRPVTVDLEALWQQLGISRQGGSVTFDDQAPLASVRDAITPPRNNLLRREDSSAQHSPRAPRKRLPRSTPGGDTFGVSRLPN
jgi:hypothetical protein